MKNAGGKIAPRLLSCLAWYAPKLWRSCALESAPYLDPKESMLFRPRRVHPLFRPQRVRPLFKP